RDGGAYPDGAGHRAHRHGAGSRRARSLQSAQQPHGRPAASPAAGPPLRPRRLGRDGGQLGAVGGRMELQRAGAGAAAGPGCRSRPQVDDGHGRSGGRDAAGAAARRAAEGGGVNLAGGRMAGWAVSALGAVLLSAYPPIRLSAQSDPRLQAAVQLAQAGRLDSARLVVRRLLAALSPADSAYPEALYTSAMLAADASTAATNLQRVVVEFGRSPWADGATTPAPGDTQHVGGATATAYAVQVLAVKSAAQVDEMLTRLKVMGFDAHVVRDTSGLFKVRVGRYATRGDAQQAQARLKTKLGGQPFLVEEP